MATRLEKLQKSLKREERRSDLKRLEKAQGYMSLAIEVLEKDLHDEDLQNTIAGIRPDLVESAEHIIAILETEK